MYKSCSKRPHHVRQYGERSCRGWIFRKGPVWAAAGKQERRWGSLLSGHLAWGALSGHLAWGAPPALLNRRRRGGCDWALTKPLDGSCRSSPEAAAGEGCCLTFTAAQPARSDEGTGIYARSGRGTWRVFC
jgi:hypothetical protein